MRWFMDADYRGNFIFVRHSGAARAERGRQPTAFAGLQRRTPQAARSASDRDVASQSSF
jgi:hypothetical protein